MSPLSILSPGLHLFKSLTIANIQNATAWNVAYPQGPRTTVWFWEAQNCLRGGSKWEVPRSWETPFLGRVKIILIAPVILTASSQRKPDPPSFLVLALQYSLWGTCFLPQGCLLSALPRCLTLHFQSPKLLSIRYFITLTIHRKYGPNKPRLWHG